MRTGMQERARMTWCSFEGSIPIRLRVVDEEGVSSYMEIWMATQVVAPPEAWRMIDRREEYPNDFMMTEPNAGTPRKRCRLALEYSAMSLYDESTSVADIDSSSHRRHDPDLDIECGFPDLIPLDSTFGSPIRSRRIFPSSSFSKQLSFTWREEEAFESGWRTRCRCVRQEQKEHGGPEDCDRAGDNVPVGRC
jgi:hypothetical protein